MRLRRFRPVVESLCTRITPSDLVSPGLAPPPSAPAALAGASVGLLPGENNDIYWTLDCSTGKATYFNALDPPLTLTCVN